MKKRDFLSLNDLTLTEHQALLTRAVELKRRRRERREEPTLKGFTLGLLFEKASTRTRVSFEAAILQLGGSVVTLPMADSQLKRGEPLEDTARVLARYCDALVFRTFGDDRLRAFAQAATVPVINGLSDIAHPVQLLADLLTVKEHFSEVSGRKTAFIGDGASNMARSWMEAAVLFDFHLTIASPEGHRPPAEIAKSASTHVKWTHDPAQAVQDAEVLSTDVWMSMGQEAESAQRRAAFAGFTVDEALLDRAAPNCLVLHCLPAHRGEEISAEVMEGPHSGIFDQAENRLHAQKALLEKLLL